MVETRRSSNSAKRAASPRSRSAKRSKRLSPELTTPAVESKELPQPQAPTPTPPPPAAAAADPAAAQDGRAEGCPAQVCTPAHAEQQLAKMMGTMDFQRKQLARTKSKGVRGKLLSQYSELFNEGNYGMTTMYFERARDEYIEKWARGAGLYATADLIISINYEMDETTLRRAADIYESIGKSETIVMKAGNFPPDAPVPTNSSSISTTPDQAKDNLSSDIVYRLLDSQKRVAAYATMLKDNKQVHGADVGEDEVKVRIVNISLPSTPLTSPNSFATTVGDVGEGGFTIWLINRMMVKPANEKN